ncbi:MAG: AraC family transcriptional regulator [Ferruginibacter sp.]|uniref:helix-turn-helix domain-containing protein n=1 Tax=Ferruginibacter sp. TaxID=1940288 RepID=UPI00265AA120|nr:helix-turn-helix domain-containing protein [Ferruginibacter sp.]MDB5280637.1 AraC family transcriptional regulator [Ferruginibacter sp.]
MFQQIYQPHPALKGFVNNIMIHQIEFDSGKPKFNFSVPPLPEQSLFFYVRDSIDAQNTATNHKETHSSSIIVGPHTNRHIMTPGFNHLMIKVGFQPGGLYRLLGIPMNELLCKNSFDCTELLGQEVKEVNDKLKDAVSFMEMKTIIEDFLIKRSGKLKEALPIDQVFLLLIKERGLIKIDQLASHACLSARQFERVFQQRIGLPPKLFSRLVRFAQAWIIKEQQPGISWIKIAHDCGYFDQMHLIRDFQEFAGVNPSHIESDIESAQMLLYNR